jgi:hypothetical protein
MPGRIEAMICPRDGSAMNCHAEKPVEPRTPEEARAAESGAGAMEQVHECPLCGAVGSRRVTG